jgi:hypothetical protein
VSFLSGSHHPAGARDASAQPQARHEIRLAGQTPPPLPPMVDVQGPEIGAAPEPTPTPRRRKRLPIDTLSLAAYAFLAPDDDPWNPERWRRLGETPPGP